MRDPFLVGQKIYLRTIDENDLNEEYQSWLNDEEVCHFNSHHRFPNYKENMLDYYSNIIKTKNNIILAVIDKKNEKHIGNIALQEINYIDRSAELAIIIGNKDYWGKGIGEEAGQLIVTHGFKTMNLHRIYCGTSKENIGMQKLASKLGFKQEGISRDALFKNGHFQDVVNYSLLENEYQK
ncbi:MAG: GNAT family protein [Candidatus Staskawiczbacteria bacterium]|nr:GNAT family protein [Candidatus Staskawiczbacteria bacterium]